MGLHSSEKASWDHAQTSGLVAINQRFGTNSTHGAPSVTSLVMKIGLCEHRETPNIKRTVELLTVTTDERRTIAHKRERLPSSYDRTIPCATNKRDRRPYTRSAEERAWDTEQRSTSSADKTRMEHKERKTQNHQAKDLAPCKPGWRVCIFWRVLL